MKVLLVWPPSPEYCVLTEDFSCCEPLGLEYIAATIIDQHDVKIADLRLDDNLHQILQHEKPDVVVISVPFTTVINVCNDLFKIVKEYNPDITLIVGGHYVTIGLKQLHTEYIDFVVRGESIETFPQLISAIMPPGKESYENIRGIGYKSGNQIIFTEAFNLVTLDNYPFPARHLTSKYRSQYFHAHYTPISLIRFSYGCPYNCSFCILWKLCQRQYISNKNNRIIDELNQIYTDNVYVVDDEAFINVKKMNDLAGMVIESGLKKRFHMYVRADTVVNNPLLFEKWAEAGLDSVLIGMESVFQEELDIYNKGINKQTSFEAMKILKNNNIEVRANFIVRPEYTRDQFQMLKQAVENLNVDRPTFAVLTPFYGTDFYETIKDKLIFDKPEFYDCYHTLLPTKLPLKDFYAEFADLFRFANNRVKIQGEEKVFYAGKSNNSFEQMVKKIENSYLYY